MKIYTYYENKYKSLVDYDQAFEEIKNDYINLDLYLSAFETLKGIVVRRRENISFNSSLSILCGCCLLKDQSRFQKAIMRVSKGNSAT